MRGGVSGDVLSGEAQPQPDRRDALEHKLSCLEANGGALEPCWLPGLGAQLPHPSRQAPHRGSAGAPAVAAPDQSQWFSLAEALAETWVVLRVPESMCQHVKNGKSGSYTRRTLSGLGFYSTRVDDGLGFLVYK